MFFRYPISDIHIHAFDDCFAQGVLAMVNELGYRQFNILSATSLGPRFAANNLTTAWLKMKAPGRCHAFAGFLYPEKGEPDAQDLLCQARQFHQLGFDGIKMMDGKPGIRKRIGIPLDDPTYDPMFSYLESESIPILYHVNDPAEFWHWELMPEWAKNSPYSVYYGDGSYPSKQQIEEEALGMLGKHPALRIIFAHFFFTADDLVRTTEIMETYPNFMVDITPGWEMFESFAQRYEEWRTFFCRYRERIFYGTDTISDHWRATVGNLRLAMETDNVFLSFEEHCKGLALDEKTLRAIYLENYERFLPARPAEMNPDVLLRYSAEMKEILASRQLTDGDEIQREIIFWENRIRNLRTEEMA